MSDPVPSFGQKLKWQLEVLAYDIVRGLLHLFPFDWVSGFFGWALRKIGPRTSKHKIIVTGLRTAFPDANAKQVHDWSIAAWDNIGRTFGEFPLLGRVKVFDKNSRVEVEGLDILQDLHAKGQGAVLISGHFANWEVMAAVFAQAGLPVRVTYRPTNNPYFDKRIRSQRQKYGIQLLVPKARAKGARELIMALRSGESIALMNDQKFREGIAVDFFGVEAMTAPGPTRLSIKTGAPLVPMSVYRTKGARFKVTIHPPIAPETGTTPDETIQNGVEQITRFIEDRIREHPPQWFWVHRRWDKSHYRNAEN